MATIDTDVDRKALLVPAAAPFYETLAPFAYTLIRVALGLILVPHGFAKLFQAATPSRRRAISSISAGPIRWPGPISSARSNSSAA